MARCEYKINMADIYNGMTTPPAVLLSKIEKGTIAYIDQLE